MAKGTRAVALRVGVSLVAVVGVWASRAHWPHCGAQEEPTVPPVPDLPILAACHRDLTPLIDSAMQPDLTMRAKDVGEPVAVAWMDPRHFLVRAAFPDLGSAPNLRAYLWPIAGKPEELKTVREAKLRWGDNVAFGSRGQSQQGSTVDRIVIGYDIVGATWADGSTREKSETAYALPVSLRLPLVPDWGKAAPASRRRVQILDQHGATVVDAEAPKELPICGWTQGCATEDRDQYLFAALTVRTAEECGRWDRVPYEVTVLAVPKSGSAARIVGVARHGAPLVDLGQLELIDRFCAFRHAVLADSATCYLTREEEYATKEERVSLASLWRWDLNGKRQLVDVLGWYRGPESHQYLLTLDRVKGLQESFRRFDTWGPARELIPGISPDGDRIAYAKDKAICVVEVGEAR